MPSDSGETLACWQRLGRNVFPMCFLNHKAHTDEHEESLLLPFPASNSKQSPTAPCPKKKCPHRLVTSQWMLRACWGCSCFACPGNYLFPHWIWLLHKKCGVSSCWQGVIEQFIYVIKGLLATSLHKCGSGHLCKPLFLPVSCERPWLYAVVGPSWRKEFSLTMKSSHHICFANTALLLLKIRRPQVLSGAECCFCSSLIPST